MKPLSSSKSSFQTEILNFWKLLCFFLRAKKGVSVSKSNLSHCVRICFKVPVLEKQLCEDFFRQATVTACIEKNLPLKVNLLPQGTSFPRCFCWNNINFEYENTSFWILCPAGTSSSLHGRRVWILRSLRQNYGRYMQKVNQRFSFEFEFTTWCEQWKKATSSVCLNGLLTTEK